MRRLALFAALLLALPSTLSAQARKIDAAAGKSWEHKPTGIEFPETLAGIPRVGVVDYSQHEWDISGQYDLPDRKTILNIYVFESQMPDAAVAFESAQHAIKKPLGRMPANFLAQPTALAPASAYAPAGQSVRSGLKIAYSSSGTYKTTALAVAAFGDHWLVKIRLSSQVLSPAETAQLLDRVIAEWSLPKDKVKQPVPVTPIAPCATMLPDLARSTDIVGKTGQALANVVLGAVAGDVGRLNTQGFPKPAFCRDAATANDRAVYRQIGKENVYFIPVNDNGSVIEVEKDLMAFLLQPGFDRSKLPPDEYLVTLMTPGTATTYLPQNRMPPPQQAYEIVTSAPFAVSNTRMQKGEKLDFGPAFKD